MKVECVHSSKSFSGNPLKGMFEFKKLAPNLQNSLITNEYIRQHCNKKYPLAYVGVGKSDLSKYLRIRVAMSEFINSLKQNFFRK